MRVRKKLGVCYVLMVLLTIAIVIPIIWLVFISMKPNSEIMNNPLSLPNALDFGNYVSALQTLDLFTLYKNTAFIAVCSLAVEIVITFSSAVGLTRLYYRSDGVRSGLQGFLQLGIALKAQFGRKAHHGGFTDPHRFAQLGGGHEGRFIVMLQDKSADALLPLGKALHLITDQLKQILRHT